MTYTRPQTARYMLIGILLGVFLIPWVIVIIQVIAALI